MDKKLDVKLKLLENTAKDMDKKLDAKLKLLENAANGLRGRFDDVKKEIVAAVAEVKREVDECPSVIEEKRRKDEVKRRKDAAARGECPDCGATNPKTCEYGNYYGDYNGETHKGHRYCGNYHCSEDGNYCE